MGPEDRYTISHKIPAAHQTFRMRAVCPAAGLSAQVKPAFTFRSPLTQKRSGTQRWVSPRFCHFLRFHIPDGRNAAALKIRPIISFYLAFSMFTPAILMFTSKTERPVIFSMARTESSRRRGRMLSQSFGTRISSAPWSIRIRALSGNSLS